MKKRMLSLLMCTLMLFGLFTSAAIVRSEDEMPAGTAAEETGSAVLEEVSDAEEENSACDAEAIVPVPVLNTEETLPETETNAEETVAETETNIEETAAETETNIEENGSEADLNTENAENTDNTENTENTEETAPEADLNTENTEEPETESDFNTEENQPDAEPDTEAAGNIGRTLSWINGSYKIDLTYDSVATGIPDDAVLSAREIEESDPAFEEYKSRTALELGTDEKLLYNTHLFDISLTNKDGSEEYEPADGSSVDVKIVLKEQEEQPDENIVHFKNDGSAEVLDAEVEETGEGQEVAFTTESLSWVAVTSTADLAAGTYRISSSSTNSGSTAITLEAASGGWYIKNSNGQYLNAAYSNYSYTVNTSNSASTVWSVAKKGDGWTISATVKNARTNQNETLYLRAGLNGITTSSQTVYLWRDDSVTNYTVTFDANGGSGTMNALTGSGTVTLTANAFTNSGYSFSNWNTAADGSGTSYADQASVTLDGNLTLYAQWSADSGSSSGGSSGNGGSSSSGSISIAKQIENTSDYNYRLHLTMDGSSLKPEKETTTPSGKKGLALIIDVSQTMTAIADGQSKFDTVRDILFKENGFISKFTADSDHELSVILIWGENGSNFGTTIYQNVSLETYRTTNSNNYHHSISPSYTTGFLAAEQLLGDSLDTVILIAGNAPEKVIDYPSGNYDRTTTGKNSGTYNANYNDYTEFMAANPNAVFYGVGIADTGSSEINDGNDPLQRMGEASGGFYLANSTETIDQAFDDIITKIEGDKTSSITMTDTLSGNISFASDVNLSATLTLLNEDGSTKNTADVSSEVTIDTSAGTVSYARASEIEGPFKLEVAFDVQTKDGVYAPAEGESYPDTGDANTDWGSNTTSSNQPGYYSNNSSDHASSAGYSLNGVASGSLDLPKPVVQAPAKPDEPVITWELAGTKYGTTSSDGNTLGGAAFRLYKADDLENAVVEAVSSSSDDSSLRGILSFLDGEGQAVKLEAGTTYILKEITAPQGYTKADDFTITITEDGTTAAVLQNGTAVPETGVSSRVAIDTSEHRIQLAIVDTAVYYLPETGAGGGYLLTGLAVILMTGCLLTLVSLRKKRSI